MITATIFFLYVGASENVGGAIKYLNHWPNRASRKNPECWSLYYIANDIQLPLIYYIQPITVNWLPHHYHIGSRDNKNERRIIFKL